MTDTSEVEEGTGEGGKPEAPAAPDRHDEGVNTRSSLVRLFVAVPPEAVLVVVLFILGLVFWRGSEFFLTSQNLRNVVLSVSVLGILAVPGTLLLISGNFDLSVASAAAMTGVAGALVVDRGALVFVLVAVGVGIAAGIVNGFLSAYAGIASIVVTLGTLQAYRGIARLMANGQTIRLEGTIDFVTGDILGIPTQIVLFIIVSIIGVFIVRLTRYGRSVYAIGSNPSAARLAGIRQRPVVFSMFVASGVMAALAGLILSSQLDAASSNAATGVELEVVAAIILGGASLSGGRGTIIGTILGVFILGVLQNGLTLLSISSFWQEIATGAVLVAAVGLDRVRIRLSGA